MMILLLIFLLLVTVTLDINPFPYTTLFRSHVGVVPLRGDLGPADGGIHLDAGHVGVAHLVGELGGVGSSALDLEAAGRSEEHTSELQSRGQLVCRLVLDKKNNDESMHEASE